LQRAVDEPGRVRAELTARLADAFGRYESSRKKAELWRSQILPDLSRVFRAVGQRRRQEPGRGTASDHLAACQALTTAKMAYNEALRETWSAVADLAALLQTEGTMGAGATQGGAAE
jgi:hypothetical protein